MIVEATGPWPSKSVVMAGRSGYVIELYFSIVQRKALTPNDFDSLDGLIERLLRFGEHYRQIAK